MGDIERLREEDSDSEDSTPEFKQPEVDLSTVDFKLSPIGVTCCLYFRPTNESKKRRKHSSFYLCVKNYANLESVKLRFRAWIENEDGKRLGDRLDESERIFDKSTKKQMWGYSEFFYHDELYSPNENFVKFDTIYVCCKISCGNELPKRDFNAQFRENLALCRNLNLHGECTFDIHGKTIQVSKLLLAAQSPVFKSMLLSNMRERSGVITLSDVSFELIEQFVEFLYSGTIQNFELVEDLFVFSDEYHILPLKNICSKHLSKDLNADNILDCLTMAFRYHDDHLQYATLTYITSKSNDYNFKQALTSDRWMDFVAHHRELAKEITTKVYDNLELV